MLTPRTIVTRRVLAALDASPARIPVLVGGCGAGKTTIAQLVGDRVGRGATQYIDVERTATTPERFFRAIAGASPFPVSDQIPAGARAAFDATLAFLGRAKTGSGEPAAFVLDEFLELRTFESFPGLRRDAVHRCRAHGDDARAVLPCDRRRVAVPGERPDTSWRARGVRRHARVPGPRENRIRRAGGVCARRIPGAADLRELPWPAARAARAGRRPDGDQQPHRSDEPLHRARSAAPARRPGAVRSDPHAAAHGRGHARHARAAGRARSTRRRLS